MSENETVPLTLEILEKEHILNALKFYGGNKTKTAKGLGITIKTLYNKLHRYGFPIKSPEVPNENLS